MSSIKHLKRCAEILWNRYDDEIKAEGDWFFALRKWEINFTLDDDRETIIAYRRKGCKTDWSNYVVLSERVREWKEVTR
jgi:hypothetical protein